MKNITINKALFAALFAATLSCSDNTQQPNHNHTRTTSSTSSEELKKYSILPIPKEPNTEIATFVSQHIDIADAIAEQGYFVNLAFDTDNELAITSGESNYSFALINAPSWLNINSKGELSGTPTSNDLGHYNFTVSLSYDDELTSETVISLNVITAGDNIRPEFSSAEIILETAAVAENYQTTMNIHVWDADKDDLTFSSENLPAWLTLSNKGELYGTPSLADVGEQSFTVFASDGQNSSQSQIRFNVIAERDELALGRIDHYQALVNKSLLRGPNISPQLNPEKWQHLGVDGFEGRIKDLQLKQVFANAESPADLFRSFFKLSNARFDRHVNFMFHSANQAFPESSQVITESYAPIRFYPDLTERAQPMYFVANLDQATYDLGVNIQDELVAVNGLPIKLYIEKLRAYAFNSTTPHFAMLRAAKYLSCMRPLHGDDILRSDNSFIYTLKSKSTQALYQVTVPVNYTNQADITWLNKPIFAFTTDDQMPIWFNRYQALGYSLVGQYGTTARLYVNHEKKTLIIEWFRMRSTQGITANLVAAVDELNAFDYGVILDTTHSRGGSNLHHLVDMLAEQPYKLSLLNYRVDDTSFIRTYAARASQYSETIEAGISSGNSFSDDEAYRLLQPVGQADVLRVPNTSRFTGKKVMLMFPNDGSALDLTASIFIENPQLNVHTIGMPFAGNARNGNEDKTIYVPQLGRNIGYSYSLGQYKSPSGINLEGNPLAPAEQLIFTQDNFSTYFEQLIQAGENYVKQ